MPFATLLSIDGIELGDYSARGLTMTLEPIAQAAAMRRNMNGELMDLSLPQFRKYRASVSCSDVESPIFVPDVWPGKLVLVRCVPYLGTGDLDDSTDQLGLVMRVVTWSAQRNEWGAVSSWSLDLEEV